MEALITTVEAAVPLRAALTTAAEVVAAGFNCLPAVLVHQSKHRKCSFLILTRFLVICCGKMFRLFSFSLI